MRSKREWIAASRPRQEGRLEENLIGFPWKLKIGETICQTTTINIPHWPAWPQLVAFHRYLAALVLSRDVDQGQLHHSEKVIAGQSILVEHLEHDLVLGRSHPEHKLLLPFRVQRLLFRLGQHRIDIHVPAHRVQVDSHVRITVIRTRLEMVH